MWVSGGDLKKKKKKGALLQIDTTKGPFCTLLHFLKILIQFLQLP